MHPVLASAIASTLATFPMTLVMELMYRKLPPAQRHALPPRKLTMAIARRARLQQRLPDEKSRVRATLAAHFAYGALTGALYPLAWRQASPRLLHGSLYGLAIWALSSLGRIPALGLIPPATRQQRGRRRLMLLAHVVWGAATAMTAARLSRAGRVRSEARGNAPLRLNAFAERAGAVHSAGRRRNMP